MIHYHVRSLIEDVELERNIRRMPGEEAMNNWNMVPTNGGMEPLKHMTGSKPQPKQSAEQKVPQSRRPQHKARADYMEGLQ